MGKRLRLYQRGRARAGAGVTTKWSNDRVVKGTNRNEDLFNQLRTPRQRRADILAFENRFVQAHLSKRSRQKVGA